MATGNADTEAGSERGWRIRWREWFALAWVIGYSVFFFHFTLPNSNPPVSRVDIWWELPEILWSNVVTPPKAPASTWANLSQRLDLFAVAGAIWLGSWAVGSLLLRAMRVRLRVPSSEFRVLTSEIPVPRSGSVEQGIRQELVQAQMTADDPLGLARLERLVFACGLGLSATSLLMLGCGLAGWMSPWLLGGLLAVALLVEGLFRVRVQREGGRQKAEGRRRKSGAWDLFLGVVSRGEQIPYGLVAKSAAVAAISLFLLAMLLGSVLPPTDFDVKAYHLTGPKEYFLNGRISFLEHNVYTNFPFLTEMLCLLGMVLRQDWYWGALAGQVVLMGFAPLTGLALFCAGRRWFGDAVGWLAATIYLTTPWTYRLAIIAYVEGALSCYLFLALFAVLLAIEALRSRVPGSTVNRLFVLAGLLAGSAMACKYPGLVSVVLPLGLASGIGAFSVQRSAVSGQRLGIRDQQGESDTQNAIGSRQWAVGSGGAIEGDKQPKTKGQMQEPEARSLKPAVNAVALFLIGTALTIGPWLLKNLVETGNPVYPLAYGIFGGRDWDAASHAKWRAGHSPKSYALSDLAEKFVDVTAKADWLSPLLFALAPLAMFVKVPSTKCQVLSEESRNSELGTRNLALSSRHLSLFLWIYVVYLFFQWWLLTHRIDRFWVPLVPVVALLAAIGCLWSSSLLWRRVCGTFIALSVLFNLGFVTTSLCGFNAYLSDLNEARKNSEFTAEPIHYINQLADAGRLPPNATVLCVGEAQVFDARPKVIYNSVFDQPIFRDWLAERPAGDVPDRDWPLRAIGEIRRTFESHGVTHVLVNWQELLRYRMTYGYSDFVTPKRFEWLREHDLLGNPAEFANGQRDFGSLRRDPNRKEDEQREVEEWAPELKRFNDRKPVFITWQLFSVQK